ncbi:MAG: hypothetical protein HC915_07950 [Anaerolineae bacterium]|nr:hypothetical protein [Anaerolineae bacterium]
MAQATMSVEMDWLDEQRILVFRLHDASNATIDTWTSLASKIYLAWPSDRPYRVLYDLRAPALSLTPYARQKILISAGFIPPRAGRVAILLAQSLHGQLIEIFLRLELQHVHPSLARQVFHEPDVALNWLRERPAP